MNFTEQEKQNALKPVTRKQLQELNKKQIIELFLGEQNLRLQVTEQKLRVEGLYINFKRLFFLKKSEKQDKNQNHKNDGKNNQQSNGNKNANKSGNKTDNKNTDKKKKTRSDHSKLASDRSPDADIQDIEVSIDQEVTCDHCEHHMVDSKLRSTSEIITVVPQDFKIERHHHVQYKCPHCSHLKTTPRVPRIKPGSNYSDKMIIATAVAKYCDLIPMNRYAGMIKRESKINIPANSLIELTHYLAAFCRPIEEKIKQETLLNAVLRADETRHRMFEHSKKNWFLWGFSSETSAFFECHASRSGDIAADILKKSACKYLLSDVYTGYSKAIKIANEERQDKIIESFCNAHARRKFIAFTEQDDASFIIRAYGLIYKIEKEKKIRRRWQLRCFKIIKKRCEKIIKIFSMQSELYKAANYFLKNYKGLTLFTQISDVRIPIDNNSQERLLRSPVIGRKTWFGTHSLQGAQTAATLFTIIESCKLNKIDPRAYLEIVTQRIHKKEKILTPNEAARDFPQIAWQGSPPRKTN